MTTQTLFVTGTDTDVGKTMLCLLLLQALAQRDVCYLKPLQTGTTSADSNSDPAFIACHLPQGLPQGMRPAQCIHTCHPLPRAPLFAGPPPTLAAVSAFIQSHQAAQRLLLVEGAGGLFVPINSTQTILDLLLSLGGQTLVVARAGLGTINHTLLTLEALKTRQLPCAGVILFDPQNQTSQEEQEENSQAIASFSGETVWGVVGHIAEPENPDPAILSMLRQGLQKAGV